MAGTVKALVGEVLPGSPAEKAGIEVGDELLAVNGSKLDDLITFRYLCADEHLELELRKPDGDARSVKIEKDFDENLGILLTGTIEQIRQCANRCLFCFVDQMPGNMRASLYVKDDDYRRSFLEGSYITLTNISAADLNKIRTMRLSPLYISVHTTNPALRQRMLGSKRAGQLMDQLRELAAAGIEMHTQVVLCPGFNDGTELEQTITELAALWPRVSSVAIVPVGLTSHRKGLFSLTGVDQDTALSVLRQVQVHQEHFFKSLGSRLVFLSDEFYLKAGAAIPPAAFYEEFPQAENGVGLVRLLLDSYQNERGRLPKRLPAPRRVAVVTGVSARGILQGIVTDMNKRVDGLTGSVIEVENRFFGPTVTVAGLMTGLDLLSGLKQTLPAGIDEVLVPRVTVRDNLFLDGVKVEEVASQVGVPFRLVEPEGKELVAALLGR